MADNMTPEQRRRTMAAVKGKNTGLERRLSSALHQRGLRFRRNVKGLSGTPDFVFPSAGVVVFVDGDFWHGWRFPQWKGKLGEYWQAKIERNRARDRRNFQRLRRAGWKVLRIWEHEQKSPEGLERVVLRVAAAVAAGRAARGGPSVPGPLPPRR